MLLLPRAQFIPGKDIYLPKPSFFIVFAVVVVVFFFFLIKSLKSVSLKLLKTACLFFESILLTSVLVVFLIFLLAFVVSWKMTVPNVLFIDKCNRRPKEGNWTESCFRKVNKRGGLWGILETAKPKKKSSKTAKKFGQNRKPHTKPSKTDTMVTSGTYRAN